jgi:methanogenic corrinoid protein MtbC1
METVFRSRDFRPSGAQPAADPDVAGLPVEHLHLSRSWTALLGETIETEILPRLLSHHRDAAETAADPEVAAFVALIAAEDIDAAHAAAAQFMLRHASREVLLNDLLAPAARLLGEMWERDTCDFTAVTLGVYRLSQIMKATASAGDAQPAAGCDRHVLLLPAPGEQHSFGLGMVAEAFRDAGWRVRSGPAASRPQLLRLVRREWFDALGLSVAADRHLPNLATCLRELRAAARNPKLYIMLGGAAVTGHEERARFLGADATARTARQAVVDADHYFETIVTESLRQSMTRLVDS